MLTPSQLCLTPRPRLAPASPPRCAALRRVSSARCRCADLYREGGAYFGGSKTLLFRASPDLRVYRSKAEGGRGEGNYLYYNTCAHLPCLYPRLYPRLCCCCCCCFCYCCSSC